MIPAVSAKSRHSHGLIVFFMAPYQITASLKLLHLSRSPPAPIATDSQALLPTSLTASQWRTQNPDLPVIKCKHMETWKALFRKLGWCGLTVHNEFASRNGLSFWLKIISRANHIPAFLSWGLTISIQTRLSSERMHCPVSQLYLYLGEEVHVFLPSLLEALH